eukprot:1412862-Pyramimonas_sp.AAC.1
MDLNPAIHKMTTTSSNPKIGRVAQGRVKHLGYRYAAGVEVLGIEVAAGRPLRFRKLRDRIRAIKRRLPRISTLRKAGAVVSRCA